MSQEAARESYGVVLVAGHDADDWRLDEVATAALRDEMRSKRKETDGMIDRGPGYSKMFT